MILQNQKRYQDSQKKSIEVDRKMVEENMRPFMEEVMDVMEKTTIILSSEFRNWQMLWAYPAVC